ncbi:c-type cytochrome [Massilia cavernae]|uniref:Cytochrome C n=1 Tax=Massilia cavernae TaxID=2320864 RepID=A0A418X6T9_9BURK|nr:c-type cytochrome [Massilia cavernae]RJG08215.1 cytochrome C' [Massilia cavernae]
MKTILIIGAIVGGATLASAASASAELAKAKNCMGCHSMTTKLVGPVFKDIANKYAGQDAENKIAQKILKGGVGAWGSVPMPPSPQLSDAEAHLLANWILSQK